MLLLHQQTSMNGFETCSINDVLGCEHNNQFVISGQSISRNVEAIQHWCSVSLSSAGRYVNTRCQCDWSVLEAIDWPVVRRDGPSGSIRADAVNTELCSLTNGHHPGEALPLTRRLPARLEREHRFCGVWCDRFLDETRTADGFTIRLRGIRCRERPPPQRIKEDTSC